MQGHRNGGGGAQGPGPPLFLQQVVGRAGQWPMIHIAFCSGLLNLDNFNISLTNN